MYAYPYIKYLIELQDKSYGNISELLLSDLSMRSWELLGVWMYMNPNQKVY